MAIDAPVQLVVPVLRLGVSIVGPPYGLSMLPTGYRYRHGHGYRSMYIST